MVATGDDYVQKVANPTGEPGTGSSETAEHAGYLRTGALSFVGSWVIALANIGPTVSIALTLSALVAVSGYGTPVVMLITAIPMLGIALASRRLNQWHVNCGATYVWGARAISPYFGWMTGWIMMLAYILGATSVALPIGSYVLSLFTDADKPSAIGSAAIGTAAIIIATGVAYVGMRATSRFQIALIVIEYAAIAYLSIRGLVAIFGSNPNAEHFQWSWFSWSSIGGISGVVGGVLLGVFMYAGWDIAVALNEETEDARRNPGRAVIAAVLAAAVLYTLLIFCLQGAVKFQDLQDNGANALSYIGTALGGTWLAKLMVLTVVLSAVGSLLAAIVSTGRIGFAMGFDKVLPPLFGRTHSKYKTPVNAMMIGSVIALLWTWLSTAGGEGVQAAIQAIVGSCGLLFTAYYAATGLSVAVYYRRLALKNLRSTLELAVYPLASAAFLVYVIYRSAPGLGGWTGQTMLYLYGLLGLGVALMLYARWRNDSDYFRRPLEAFNPNQADLHA